jgi:hypothetical protein
MSIKAKEAAAKAADAAKGFQVVQEGNATPIPLVYGRAVVGGVRVFAQTYQNFVYSANITNATTYVYNSASNGMNASFNGNTHSFMLTQQALCMGGINAVYCAEVDDALFDDPKFAKDGKGGQKIIVYTEGNTACAHAGAMDGTRSTAYFTNVAYCTGIFNLNRDEPQYNGVPNCRFYIEGMKIASIVKTNGLYKVSATKTYSNNPALCLLDLLTSSIYGRGLTADEIDLKSFYLAAKICDTIVMTNVVTEGRLARGKGSYSSYTSNTVNSNYTYQRFNNDYDNSTWSSTVTRSVQNTNINSTSYTGTRNLPLYELNGTFSTDASIRDNIEEILASMGDAYLVWTGGKVKLQLSYPGVYVVGAGWSKSMDEGAVVQADNMTGLTVTATNLWRNTVDGNTNAPGGAGWVLHTRAIGDDDIVQDAMITSSWPTAQNRFNHCVVKFRNEAKDFTDDTAEWPPKYGRVDGGNIDRGAWVSGDATAIAEEARHKAAVDGGNNNDILNAALVIVGRYNASDIVTYGGQKYQLQSGVYRSTTVPPPSDSYWRLFNSSVTNSVYETFRKEDNELALETTVDTSYCVDYWHALAIAEQTVRRSRMLVNTSISVISKHWDMEPGDYIKLTSQVLNIPGELYRINSVKFVKDGYATWEIEKSDARYLAWNVADNEVVTPRNIYDIRLASGTNLLYTEADATTPARLVWVPANDARVSQYTVKIAYDTPGLTDVSQLTWIDLGTVSADVRDGNGKVYFNMEPLDRAPYWFTVVSSDGVNTASKSSWPIIHVLISGNILQATALSFAQLDNYQDLSGGRLSWTASLDPYATGYYIYATTDAIGAVGIATVWQELGFVSQPITGTAVGFSVPALPVGTYTLAVATTDSNKLSLRSAWPTVSANILTVNTSEAVTLSASEPMFVTPKNSSTPAPATIVLTADSDVFAVPHFKWYIDGVLQTNDSIGALTVTSNTFSLASFPSGSKRIEVRVTEASVGAYVFDIFTVYSLKEGSDAYTYGLDNENQTITCDSAGTPTAPTSISANFKVYQGSTDVTSTFTLSVASSSNYPSGNASINSSGVVSISPMSAMTADACSVTFRATKGSVVLDKVLTFNKSKAGVTGPSGSQGIAGNNTYFHIAYADSADGSLNFNQTAGKYIGTYVDTTPADSNSYLAYQWVKVAGTDGIAGTNGANGQTSYLHIKYSNDGGSSFTASAGEAVGDWIGTYVDFTVADSNSPGAYTWAKIVGAQGPQGPTGPTGGAGGTGAAGDTAVFAYAVLTSASLPASPSIGLNAVPTNSAAVAVAVTLSPPFYTQPKASLASGEWMFQVSGTRTAGGTYTWQTLAYLSTFKVGQLSALGVTTGNLTVDTAGAIKGGQTDFNTGSAGFFLGYSGGGYKFSIGNPAGNYMTFDATTGSLVISRDQKIASLSPCQPWMQFNNAQIQPVVMCYQATDASDAKFPSAILTFSGALTVSIPTGLTFDTAIGDSKNPVYLARVAPLVTSWFALDNNGAAISTANAFKLTLSSIVASKQVKNGNGTNSGTEELFIQLTIAVDPLIATPMRVYVGHVSWELYKVR